MGREDPHFRLRIPEELRDRVRLRAEANGRSMTAEIVLAIEAWLDRPPGGLIPQNFSADQRVALAEDIAEAILRGNKLAPYLKPERQT